jgi:hypothetical protein
MLFNIFTPDEVDFLSTLIGDDALKQIQVSLLLNASFFVDAPLGQKS